AGALGRAAAHRPPAGGAALRAACLHARRLGAGGAGRPWLRRGGRSRRRLSARRLPAPRSSDDDVAQRRRPGPAGLSPPRPADGGRRPHTPGAVAAPVTLWVSAGIGAAAAVAAVPATLAILRAAHHQRSNFEGKRLVNSGGLAL